MLVNPVGVVGDVDGGKTQLGHRQNIRFQRVAHHHEIIWRGSEAGEKAAVSGFVLLAHDFDVVEKVAQARAGNFAFLVE